MARAIHQGLNEKQLRGWLLAFFFALSIPALLLVYHAYDQLKWEVFHQYRLSAEELSARIDGELRRAIEAEEARSFSEYAFLSVAGDSGATFVQRSPISGFPLEAAFPGLVGYFQVNSEGQLTSPTLPDGDTKFGDFGVSDEEYAARRAFNTEMKRILNVSLPPPPAPPLPRALEFSTEGLTTQADKKEKAVLESTLSVASEEPRKSPRNVFDRLSKSLGNSSRQRLSGDYARVEDLNLDSRLEQKSRERIARTDFSAQIARPAGKRASRKEQVAVYELSAGSKLDADDSGSDTQENEVALAEAPSAVLADEVITPGRQNSEPKLRVRFFESEIDPFNFEILDSLHFVLYRNAWRAGERFIQGAIIERAAFIDAAIGSAYTDTNLSTMSEVLAAFQGEVLAAHGGRASREYFSRPGELSGELLYRTRLSAPLSALELIFTVTALPLGPGARYLAWVALLLAVVLTGGCFVIYRYGVGQISLYRQQQDFVSAVSHELKTPLTSIRMYSEMLKAGWADEDKKATYYAFIHDESERLSRLIANVLQLSRMTRGNASVDLKNILVSELVDITRSKISSQVERAGFALRLDVENEVGPLRVNVDADALTQIMINLVDNAIKFSPKGTEKRIDISVGRQRSGTVRFAVRDFGAGVPKDQMRRIFELFYRPQSELTRETVGTGIGLALVHQLTSAMGGRVDVRNSEPGAEFSVSFPVVDAAADA